VCLHAPAHALEKADRRGREEGRRRGDRGWAVGRFLSRFVGPAGSVLRASGGAADCFVGLGSQTARRTPSFLGGLSRLAGSVGGSPCCVASGLGDGAGNLRLDGSLTFRYLRLGRPLCRVRGKRSQTRGLSRPYCRA